METKICKICGKEKSLKEFKLDKVNGKVYYRHQCKKCLYEKYKHKYKEYRENNKEKISQFKKEYAIKNKDIIIEKSKKYRENNKEKIRESKKRYYQKNKKKVLEKNKIYKQQHEIETKEYKSKWYQENKNRLREHQKKNVTKETLEKIREYKHQYYLKNKDKYVKNNQDREKIRMKIDKMYRFKKLTRQKIRMSFKRKGMKKSKSTEQILGCSLEYFYLHLLETYKKNYNEKWNEIEPVDIDHIIPLDTAKTEEDIIRLCHYTNLQLLKHLDNVKKSNKLNFELKN